LSYGTILLWDDQEGVDFISDFAGEIEKPKRCRRNSAFRHFAIPQRSIARYVLLGEKFDG
jgi:hypothetical protein